MVAGLPKRDKPALHNIRPEVVHTNCFAEEQEFSALPLFEEDDRRSCRRSPTSARNETRLPVIRDWG